MSVYYSHFSWLLVSSKAVKAMQILASRTVEVRERERDRIYCTVILHIDFKETAHTTGMHVLILLRY